MMRKYYPNPSFNREKIFLYSPPPEMDFSLTYRAPSNWEIHLSDMLKSYNPSLINSLEKHIGRESTYSHKQTLINSLKIIYCRLTHIFDDTLGKLSEKAKIIILSKLAEDITACTTGLHNRVNDIIQMMGRPSTFDQLLHLTRETVISETAAILSKRIKNDLGMEVHAANTIIAVAHRKNLGVRAQSLTDPIRGTDKTDKEIFAHILEYTQKIFTPFKIPLLICNQLQELCLEAGYTGRKNGTLSETADNLSSITYDKGEMDAILNLLNNFITISKADLFIIETDADEITQYVRDVDWQKICLSIFEKLIHDGYFKYRPKPQNLFEYACISKIAEMDDILSEILEDTLEKEGFFSDFINLRDENPSLLIKILNHPLLTIDILEAKLAEEKNITHILEISPILVQHYPRNFLPIIIKKLSNRYHTERDFLNGFLLMSKFLENHAKKNDTQSALKITDTLYALTTNCSPEDLTILLNALYQTPVNGKYAHKNGVFIIINALACASYKKNVKISSEIAALLTILLIKSAEIAPSESLLALSQRPSEFSLSYPNNFYFLLTLPLFFSVKADMDSTPAIIDLLDIFLSRYSDNGLFELIKGLSELRHVNGWHYLLSTASHALTQNKTDICFRILKIFKNIITQCCEQPTYFSMLCKGLLDEEQSDSDAGKSTWYQLMEILDTTVIENDTHNFLSLIEIMNIFFEKFSIANHLSEFIGGLSRPALKGEHSGKTPIFCMMRAFSTAVTKNIDFATKIIDAFNTLFLKCEKMDFIELCSALLKSGDVANKTALFFMMKALSDASLINTRNHQYVALKVISIIEKIFLNLKSSQFMLFNVYQSLTMEVTIGDGQNQANAFLFIHSAIQNAATNRDRNLLSKASSILNMMLQQLPALFPSDTPSQISLLWTEMSRFISITLQALESSSAFFQPRNQEESVTAAMPATPSPT